MTNQPLILKRKKFASPFFADRFATARGTGRSLFLISLLGLGGGCDATLHIGKVLGDSGGNGNGSRDSGFADGGYDGPGLGSVTPADGGFVPPMRTPPIAHAPLTGGSKVDLLFMVDDSSSMAPLQQKMRSSLANFMDVLKSLPGGLPDLHVAVVSSSLGAGVYGNVPGCAFNTAGNLNGSFQHAARCSALNAGQSFIASTVDATGTRVNNFTGDITDVFSCIADLGDGGCGFEHQFEATRLALQKAQSTGDENSGFLRSDAYLAIVLLTNEDDCSVPVNSMLFDPAQESLADPLGGLQSYRCNEFGHLCDGQSPPHDPPGMPQTFSSCVSNESGPLIQVNGFIDFLFSLKPMHPEKVFLAAIAGPPTPYVVESRPAQLQNGSVETQPSIRHSCTSTTGEYADPGVRIKELTGAFGPNSFFGSICADDFGPTMRSIGQVMVAP